LDVWSVGIMHFQLLTGRVPFGNDETATELHENHTIFNARNVVFPTDVPISHLGKQFIRRYPPLLLPGAK